MKFTILFGSTAALLAPFLDKCAARDFARALRLSLREGEP